MIHTDKELIKEFIDTKNFISNDAIRMLLNDYEDFKKQKEASVSKELEYEVLEYGWQENQEDKPDIKVIWKVKRLSDGVVFKVGDNTNYGTIKSFKEFTRVIEVKFTDGSGSYLQSLSHSKVALFKTADGVEVFSGENYFAVGADYLIRYFTAFEKDELTKEYIRFSTRELAKEYIDFNKPTFSLNDIKACYNTKSYCTLEWFIEALKEHKKLNQ